eukprot:jgi/Tetstr1/421856/TSEL_012756.t1
MEAVDDGHRFRLAYLRKHWDTQMHHSDTFGLGVVRERYLRPGTENLGSAEFSELLDLCKDRVSDANIASAARTTARRNASAAPSGATTATGTGAAAAAKTSRLRVEGTPTYFIADAEAHAPWSELMRGSIEALYGTDDRGAKVLDLQTTSLTASTYNYEGKIGLFAEFCIDDLGIFPLDCTESNCVRYLAWIAEHGTIVAGSLQPYLSAINTFLRHTGRDDAPATGPTIGDMKWALQIRQLKTSEELWRAPLPCDVITDILDDLATLLMTTPGYGTILRTGAAVYSTFMFYSRGEPSISCRLRNMAVDTHNITLFVNRKKGGHRKLLINDYIDPTTLPTRATAILFCWLSPVWSFAAFSATPRLHRTPPRPLRSPEDRGG